MLWEIDKDASPTFKSVRFPQLQLFVEIFCTNLQGPVCWCTSVIVAAGSVNIWNLLWLFRRLINRTEQTRIYINTFPNTVTSEQAKNHEISIYFWTNAFVA